MTLDLIIYCVWMRSYGIYKSIFLGLFSKYAQTEFSLNICYKNVPVRGWGFSSAVERLPSERKALGSVPSSEKKKRKKKKNVPVQNKQINKKKTQKTKKRMSLYCNVTAQLFSYFPFFHAGTKVFSYYIWFCLFLTLIIDTCCQCSISLSSI